MTHPDTDPSLQPDPMLSNPFDIILNEMFDCARDFDHRWGDCQAYAARCIELAAAGEPCVRACDPDVPHSPIHDYAMLKFVAAQWDDERYAPLFRKVFAAFVQHGLVDPNRKLVVPREVNIATHFVTCCGHKPLFAAVIKGNICASEALILHGASTDGAFENKDFLDFVRAEYGSDSPFSPDEDARHIASVRLLRAMMERQVNVIAAEAASAHAPLRRNRAI